MCIAGRLSRLTSSQLTSGNDVQLTFCNDVQLTSGNEVQLTFCNDVQLTCSIALVVIVGRLSRLTSSQLTSGNDVQQQNNKNKTKQQQTSQLTSGNDVQPMFGNDVHCRASFSFDFFAAHFW